MAMIKCAECGQLVSTLARACPHCGAPPRSTTSARLVAMAALVAALLATGLTLAMRDRPVGGSPMDALIPLLGAVILLAGFVVAALLKRRG